MGRFFWLRRYIPQGWRGRSFRLPYLTMLNGEPAKEPKKLSDRPPAFDPDVPTPLSHRKRDTSEEDWVATPWNGTIPILIAVIVMAGLADKALLFLPCPNDGEFGPMKYTNNPDAKYWGNYRKNIEPRKGRRHLDIERY
jgi:hypothetical protein